LKLAVLIIIFEIVMKYLNIIVLVFFFQTGFSLSPIPRSFDSPDTVSNDFDETLDSSVVDLVINEGTVWFATGNGLGRTDDNGKTFRGYFKKNGLSDDIIASVDAKSSTVLCGIIDSKSVYPQWSGAGVCLSNDTGLTWREIGEKQGLTGVEGLYQVAWDVYLDGSDMWVATWTKGLFHSTDGGNSFKQILPQKKDGYEYHTYEIDINYGSIWVGCEGGVARTKDGGITWNYYSQVDGKGYIGGFTPSVHIMAPGVVWAGTGVDMEHMNGSGVNMTLDDGEIWQNFNTGNGIGSNVIYDITSIGDTVYLATDGGGVAYSGDYGQTWQLATVVNGLPSNFVYCIDTDGSVLWAGTDFGLARSDDGGNTWQAFDYTTKPGDSDSPRSIAYPNPFAPSSTLCTIEFSLGTSRLVTLKIYDFSGAFVRTLAESEFMGPQDDIKIAWDGRDSSGRVVDNGVYFYILDIEGTPLTYGKIAVLE